MTHLRVETVDETQMLSMLKDILLKGTLEFRDYKVLEAAVCLRVSEQK